MRHTLYEQLSELQATLRIAESLGARVQARLGAQGGNAGVMPHEVDSDIAAVRAAIADIDAAVERLRSTSPQDAQEPPGAAH